MVEGVVVKVELDETVSSTRVLRCRKIMQKWSVDSNVDEYGICNSLERVVCRAIFEFVVNGIDAVDECFRVEMQGLAKELLIMEHVRFHRRFNTCGARFKVGLIQSVLKRAVEEYPHNVWLWSILREYEGRFDRFKLPLVSDFSLVQLYTIYSEHKQGKNVKNMLENSSLWFSNVLYANQMDGEGAKMQFWRGIQACPWSKPLYLLGLLELPFSEEEKDEIWRVMSEKELRQTLQ